MEAFQKKPTGVILLSLFLIVAFTMDFYNGAMMIFGVLPIVWISSLVWWNSRLVSFLWYIESQELGKSYSTNWFSCAGNL
jgi:hypothetical protein